MYIRISSQVGVCALIGNVFFAGILIVIVPCTEFGFMSKIMTVIAFDFLAVATALFLMISFSAEIASYVFMVLLPWFSGANVTIKWARYVGHRWYPGTHPLVTRQGTPNLGNIFIVMLRDSGSSVGASGMESRNSRIITIQ